MVNYWPLKISTFTGIRCMSQKPESLWMYMYLVLVTFCNMYMNQLTDLDTSWILPYHVRMTMLLIRISVICGFWSSHNADWSACIQIPMSRHTYLLHKARLMQADLGNSKLIIHPLDELEEMIELYNNIVTEVMDNHALIDSKHVTEPKPVPWYNVNIQAAKWYRK